MAYTKILVIHNRLDKCVDYTQDEEKTSLEAAIDYALNREKTERTCFETAVNCDRERVYQDMMDTKRRWGKADRRRKGYHVIQSFAPGEVTPEEAHAIGVELAQRLLGDRYEVVVSTHLNKAHLHSHLVFNSVSFLDGAMYRDTFKDLFGGDGVGIRGTSDAICLEHGLSIIEPSEPLKGSAASRAEWEAEQKGKPTFRGMVRRDIETAIANSYTMRSFWQQLEQMGYTVKHGPNITHPAVKPPGGQRFIRLGSQKLGYTLESDSKDMEKILPQLAATREVTTEDGYTGLLTLDTTSIKTEASGYGSSTRTVTATRSYPNLSDADVSLIPKTTEDNKRTLTLADVDWQEDNGLYHATATYTGVATSSYVKGYIITADYIGDVSRITGGTVTYTAVFSGSSDAQEQARQRRSLYRRGAEARSAERNRPEHRKCLPRDHRPDQRPAPGARLAHFCHK